MRVLVSVDMEGISGVVDGEDVSPGQSEYDRSRSLITAEANAAVRGVYAGDPGAQVLVVVKRAIGFYAAAIQLITMLGGI